MLIQHRGQFKRLKYELAPLIAVIPKVPLLSSLVFYLKYIYKITYLLNFYYYPNKIRKGFRVFSSDYNMARFSHDSVHIYNYSNYKYLNVDRIRSTCAGRYAVSTEPSENWTNEGKSGTWQILTI